MLTNPAPAQRDARLELDTRRTIDVLRRHLGDSLLAVHLFGSAAAGGLGASSDVDFLAAVDCPLREEGRHALVDDLLRISGKHAEHGPARPLEVTIVVRGEVIPWRYPPICELQFGEWLREEFLRKQIPPRRHDPDLAILLTMARQHSRALLGPDAAVFFDAVPTEHVIRAMLELLPEVAGRWQGDERNVILTLSRMWATARTGAVLSKDIAAEWALSRLPVEQQAILELARLEYRGLPGTEWKAVRADVEAFVTHVRRTVEENLRRQLDHAQL